MKFMPQIHIEIERWKYHMPLDIYVSNLGRIKDTAGEIQTVCKKDNYLYYKGKAVHRIVMQTWKPTPGYAWLTVDHKNHNTWDNRISNLEWVTNEENSKRNIEDTKANSPTFAPPSDEATVKIQFVILNNVKVELKVARELMRNDKSLASCQKQVDATFNKFLTGTADEVKYGNYTLKRVK